MNRRGWLTLVATTLAFASARLDAQARGVKGPAELRVVIGRARDQLRIGGAGEWEVRDAWNRVHARSASGSPVLERQGRRLRLAGVGNSAWSDRSFSLTSSARLVAHEGSPYRGELRFVATDTAILVVNIVPLEQYLRGVVPLELGSKRQEERSAVEAQAIVARSFAVARAMQNVTRDWDLGATTLDQVYGGARVETREADAAIAATDGLVLTWQGRPVRAPYHSSCGGVTAAAHEVWNGPTEPWLQAVDDHNPASGEAWCSEAPRFSWQATFDQQSLLAAARRHAPSTTATRIVRASLIERSPTGRARTLRLETDAGALDLRGNEIRFALRSARGEILNSTYFSLREVPGTGFVGQLELDGRGYGHGIGMCQWGAMGRARAGHDASRILAAYYPGTRVERLVSH